MINNELKLKKREGVGRGVRKNERKKHRTLKIKYDHTYYLMSKFEILGLDELSRFLKNEIYYLSKSSSIYIIE